MTASYCNDRGKIIYASKAEAMRARGARNKDQHYLLRAYHCAACGQWHLGREKSVSHRKRFRGLPA